MMDFPFSSKREKAETTLLLDIGTETVKALLFQENGPKINILASSFEYFDRYGAFDSRDFEKDILKRTISRTLQKIGEDINKSIILGLPADILKARIVYQNLKRLYPKKTIASGKLDRWGVTPPIDEKEEKDIYRKVAEEVRNNISREFSQESGILPADLQFVHLKILETKIDGYQIPTLQKFQGENLDFRILTTFLAKHYLEEIETIIESLGLKVAKVVHEAEGLKSYFTEKNDGIFVDIGGTITQIFLIRNGLLEKINDFPIGGQIFSKAISEKLGLGETQTRILKERYSKKELSKESSDRMGEILWPAGQTWFENLKQKLEEMAIGYLPALNIILFGGGSQLPNIKDIFKTNAKNRVSLGSRLEVKILNNPQEIPLLLMAYA